MTETQRWQRKSRRTFPGISPAAFQHPMDLKALEAVKKAKGVDFLIRKVIEYGYERYYYITNIADSIRVNNTQCPLLHDMLLEACDILNVNVPEFYVDQNPIANAYTFGSEKPFIVLESGLVDLMTDDELFTVICHEVGHIKCGHVLYKMVARFLTTVAQFIMDRTFGLGGLLTGPLLIAFYEWDRKAELSADRAGLLGIQNPDTVITTLMKLAGGCRKVAAQMSKEEFLRQAENYQDLDESTLNQFYKFLQVITRTHPFPVLRAREIHEWGQSTEYHNILNGIYPRTDMQAYAGGYGFGGYQPPPSSGYPPPNYPPSPSYPPSGFSGSSMGGCPNCGASVDINASFCHICGSTIIGSIAVLEKNANKPPSNSPPSPNIGSSPSQTINQQTPPQVDNKPRCRNCGVNLKTSDDYCPNCGMNTRFDW